MKIYSEAKFTDDPFAWIAHRRPMFWLFIICISFSIAGNITALSKKKDCPCGGGDNHTNKGNGSIDSLPKPDTTCSLNLRVHEGMLIGLITPVKNMAGMLYIPEKIMNSAEGFVLSGDFSVIDNRSGFYNIKLQYNYKPSISWLYSHSGSF